LLRIRDREWTRPYLRFRRSWSSVGGTFADVNPMSRSPVLSMNLPLLAVATFHARPGAFEEKVGGVVFENNPEAVLPVRGPTKLGPYVTEFLRNVKYVGPLDKSVIAFIRINCVIRHDLLNMIRAEYKPHGIRFIVHVTKLASR
jgi:hypothetical protein